MDSHSKKLSRRQFVKGSAAAAAAFTIVPRHVLGGPDHVPPSEKLNIAIVGCGGQGRTNVRQLLQFDDVQIVTVADPRDQADYSPYYYGGLAGRLPVKNEIETHYQQTNPKFKCSDYVDFRDMFDKEKNIDAVLCATPDHWHALIAMAAMKRGKHIYCEKPLSHNIREARQLAKTAKESKVATQMGNQGRSSHGHPIMCEWLRDGAIGTVSEVRAWSAVGSWINHKGRPQQTMPVPEGFDWKLWLGPRPFRPYHSEYAPYNWRAWWSFGSGCVGDMSIHHFDSAWSALQLGHPAWVEGKSEWVDSEVSGSNNEVTWMFEKTDKRPAVKFVWRDGSKTFDRPQVLEEGRSMHEDGVLVIGDKGKILGGGWSASPRIIPEVKMKAYKRPPKTLPRSKGHHRNWVDACKNGTQAVSNFEYGARLTEFVLLGNIAIRTGKRIKWDGEKMTVKGQPHLDALIGQEYPKEWDLNNI
ncbi:MAG: Gfo/Idh/MocA family protein [Planctomycetota bacterium]